MTRPLAMVADPLPLILMAATLAKAVAVASVLVAITGPRRVLAVVPTLALGVGAALAGWFTPVGPA